MKHLALELGNYLAGPPTIRQQDFSFKSGLAPSKISRVLADKLTCDSEDLDCVLRGIPDIRVRRRIVSAYLRDVASSDALALVRRGRDDTFNLELKRLSRKGANAVRALLSSDRLEDVEKILAALAEAFGKDATATSRQSAFGGTSGTMDSGGR